MTKQEIINRYGEEAYKERLKKKREYDNAHKDEIKQYQKQYQKQYYNTHKEEKKQYDKQYRDAHKEEYKRYRDTHKEEIKQHKKKYYDTHKEEAKQYYDAHSEELKQYQKQYWKTPMGRAVNLANTYNQKDKKKGFDITNNVDSSYIIERIFTAKCVYCGDSEWRHLGCDRIDNTKPHTPDNVVCACGICNTERSDRMSMEEMLEHRTTNPRMLRNMNAPIEKTPSGAIKKRVFAVIG